MEAAHVSQMSHRGSGCVVHLGSGCWQHRDGHGQAAAGRHEAAIGQHEAGSTCRPANTGARPLIPGMPAHLEEDAEGEEGDEGHGGRPRLGARPVLGVVRRLLLGREDGNRSTLCAADRRMARVEAWKECDRLEGEAALNVQPGPNQHDRLVCWVKACVGPTVRPPDPPAKQRATEEGRSLTCTRWIITLSIAAPASAPTTQPAVPSAPPCCTSTAACMYTIDTEDRRDVLAGLARGARHTTTLLHQHCCPHSTQSPAKQ